MSVAAADDSLWLAIDVGVVNLALALCRVSSVKQKVTSVVAIERIDLTRLTHRRVPRHACTLRHDTSEMCDRVAHLAQEYDPDWFDRASTVLIERQPLHGLKCVEQLLMARYAHKMPQLVHPCSVHHWRNVAHLSYDQRKEASVADAERLLMRTTTDDAAVWRSWHALSPRQHDVADALMLIQYRLSDARAAYKQRKRWTAAAATTTASLQPVKRMDNLFDAYRYRAPTEHRRQQDDTLLSAHSCVAPMRDDKSRLRVSPYFNHSTPTTAPSREVVVDDDDDDHVQRSGDISESIL